MLTRYSLTQHADRFFLLFADALHLSPAPTEQLYDRQIRPIVHAAMSGYNGTCFAYGQTAAIVIVIVVAVTAIDLLSQAVRTRLL